MATIDIRDNFPTVDIIRFWDNPTGNYLATGLTYIDGEVKIEDLENIRSLKISSSAHAQNIIKALEKAIELGWFE